MPDISAGALGELISATDSHGIATQARELVESGTLDVGARLPTVRAVAGELGVSIGTVAKAWSLLRDAGLIETRQRAVTTALQTRHLNQWGGEYMVQELHWVVSRDWPFDATLPELAAPVAEAARGRLCPVIP